MSIHSRSSGDPFRSAAIAITPTGPQSFPGDTAGIDAPAKGKTPTGMTLEHAYPAQWIVIAMHCGSNRVECRANMQSHFGFREADMHNLFPAWGNANSSRGDNLLGEIAGEDRRWPDCDFENKAGIVEPRPIIRGNFARAIFYMHTEYGLPIDPAMLQILIKWNRQDPVNRTERRRNDKIEELQGTRNPFIDDADREQRKRELLMTLV
jgi:deoxyribonuclease I